MLPFAGRRNLALNILNRRSNNLLTSPHTNTANGAKGKQHTKCNAETPDSLHLKASSSARAGPDPIIDFLHVGGDGGQERGSGA